MSRSTTTTTVPILFTQGSMASNTEAPTRQIFTIWAPDYPDELERRLAARAEHIECRELLTAESRRGFTVSIGYPCSPTHGLHFGTNSLKQRSPAQCPISSWRTSLAFTHTYTSSKQVSRIRPRPDSPTHPCSQILLEPPKSKHQS